MILNLKKILDYFQNIKEEKLLFYCRLGPIPNHYKKS